MKQGFSRYWTPNNERKIIPERQKTKSESETAPVYCLVECFQATHSTGGGTEE